jgi:hypothetical protein
MVYPQILFTKWRLQKMLNILSWFGTLVSILGSFAVASAMFKLGYVLFTFGSLAWLIVAFVRRDRSLGVLNGTFFLANLLGIYNNFF